MTSVKIDGIIEGADLWGIVKVHDYIYGDGDEGDMAKIIKMAKAYSEYLVETEDINLNNL